MDKYLNTAKAVITQKVPILLAALQTRLPAPIQAVQRQLLTQLTSRFPFLVELWAQAAAGGRSPASEAHGPPVKSAPGTTGAYEAWLVQLHSAANYQDRAAAARSLRHAQQAPGVLEALVSALRDGSAEVACAAAEALGEIGLGVTEAQRALWAVLDDEEGYYNVLVRAAALTALTRCLPEGELAGVFRAIQDQDAEVSIAAISAVLSRAPDQAPRYLLPILVDNHGYYLPVVRLAAARGFETSRTLEHEVLADLVQREQDPDVRFVLQRIVGSGGARLSSI